MERKYPNVSPRASDDEGDNALDVERNVSDDEGEGENVSDKGLKTMMQNRISSV